MLIKASGDIVERRDFQRICKEITTQKKSKVVVICGSGKQINEAFREKGYTVEYDNMGERVFCSSESEKLSREILLNTRNMLQNALG